jgi:hypothetical protein
MGRQSRIAKLDPAIKGEVDRLIREGRHTIDQIVAHLRELGTELPRSTVGDYKKNMEKKLARYREAQEVAGVWVAQLGQQSDSHTGQLLAELLKTVAFRTLADMQDQDSGTEAGDLMLLAKALDHMARAQKTDQEFRERVRAAYRAELEERAKAAQEEVAEVARSAGLTEEAATRMREIVLGVVG